MVCAALSGLLGAQAQEPAAQAGGRGKARKHFRQQEEKAAEKTQLPFQIQLLETHVRFEANGDSRKEVHTIVKIINILGAQQFARISFDYNRRFSRLRFRWCA